MTRINCVPVKELCNSHLFAEFRELPRIQSYMNKSLESNNYNDLPPSYILGIGHVKFFYNKLNYLVSRYNELRDELLLRGYNIEYKDLNLIAPTHWFNDWSPSKEEIEINRARIKERMPKNPKWVTSRGK